MKWYRRRINRREDDDRRWCGCTSTTTPHLHTLIIRSATYLPVDKFKKCFQLASFLVIKQETSRNCGLIESRLKWLWDTFEIWRVLYKITFFSWQVMCRRFQHTYTELVHTQNWMLFAENAHFFDIFFGVIDFIETWVDLPCLFSNTLLQWRLSELISHCHIIIVKRTKCLAGLVSQFAWLHIKFANT